MSILKDVVEKMVPEKEVLQGQATLVDPELIPEDQRTGIIQLSRDALLRLTGEMPLEHLLSSEEDVLGSYTPMTSPGHIRLHARELKAMLWHMVDILLNRRQLPIVKADFKGMAHLVASATYHHEYFHFFCDIQRKLFPSSKYHHDKEEALAVAYSHRKLDEEHDRWQSIIGRMAHVIYPALMEEKFRYTSAGYRDWTLYSDKPSFASGITDYINPTNRKFLESSGVDVNALLLAQLEKVYTFRVNEDLV